jgi:hypothetical protein
MGCNARKTNKQKHCTLQTLQGILLFLKMSAVNISGFSELACNYEVCEGRWMGTFLHWRMFQNCMARFTASIKVNKVSKIIIC